MNIPIFLTLLRIGLVPLLVVLLLAGRATTDLWAIVVLLVAAGTDLFAGYLARKKQQTTTLGTLLDPIADKLLTSAAFISLLSLQLVPAWAVAVILGREYAISGLRSLAAAEGFTVAASQLGKVKMALQVASITTIILGVRFPILQPAGLAMLWLVVVIALISGLQYLSSYCAWGGLRGFLRRVKWPMLLRRRPKEDVPTH